MKKLLALVLIFVSGCANDGNDGVSGRNGFNSIIELVNLNLSCVNGGFTVLSALDTNRNNHIDPGIDLNIQSKEICNGSNGHDGEDGEDGHDGHDGEDGHNASMTPFTPVSLINPCGDASGIIDEVFIRLNNGIILASFSQNSNGNNTRLASISPGSYVTTDGDNCYFSVNSNLDIINEHH